MKKKLLVFLNVLMISLLVSMNVFAKDIHKDNDEFEIVPDEEAVLADKYTSLAPNAKSAVLIEPSTMSVVYEKNPYEKLAPASMTKIMTMLLVMEAINDGVLKYDQFLTASEYATTMGGTQIYLERGEKMTVDDLLKSVAVASANDAAVVLAEGISGSNEAFVSKMNEKAKELGLNNTNFKNCNGLPEDDHYSCAIDMAKMSAHLINNYPDILKYTSIYEDYVREDNSKKFWLVNKNKLVKFVDGVDGLKTGWTNEAGYCITATIQKDGIRFIGVVMGNSSPDIRNKEVMQMLNYGIANYELTNLYKNGDIIKKYENIDLLPKIYHIVISEDVNILKKKSDKNKEISTEELINYENIDGINNNDIGSIKIYYDGKLYKEVKLTLLEEVKKASFFNVFFEVLKEIFLVTI